MHAWLVTIRQACSAAPPSPAVPQGKRSHEVCWLAEEATGRQYALKRMRKAAVVQCPEHVFCEQAITRNTAHPFCIRQYASFQARCLGTGWWQGQGLRFAGW